MKNLMVTKQNLSIVFNNWFNDYKTDKSKFADIDNCNSSDEYGQDCANYMFSKLEKLGFPKVPIAPKGRTITER